MKSHLGSPRHRVIGVLAIAALLTLAFAFLSPGISHPVLAQIGTCPEGGSVIPGTACESGYVPCLSGAIVSSGSACPLSSSGGVCALATCPLGGTACPGGASTLVTAGAGRCAAQPAPACPGGATAVNGVCPPTTKVCPSGVIVSVTQNCPSNYNCPPGQTPAVNSPCPGAPQNTVCPDGSVLPPGATCPPAANVTPVAGIVVTYPAGWNIVAGPSGTVVSGAVGSFYTMQTGDATYETLPLSTPLKAGVGYLAFFPATAQSNIPPASPSSTTVQLAPGQFVLIGNPGNTPATVAGADVLLVLDPATGTLSPGTVLAPGQGAWGMSSFGGQAIITNAPS